MRALLLALILAFVPAAAGSDEDLAKQLLDQTDDIHRGSSSQGKMTMHVKTEHWDRTMEMEVWSKGTNKSLVRILSPAKDAGTSTLKVDDNIWNYLPKVDRTMKVPASMLGGSWMGSHYTNDDLVKQSRMAVDYTYNLTSKPSGGQGDYVIECLPRPDAAVVWGKLVVTLDGKTQQPKEITYWSEKGALARTMQFSDPITRNNRTFPSRIKLIPADKPDEFTEISYEQIDFDVDLPDSTFTLQSLKP